MPAVYLNLDNPPVAWAELRDVMPLSDFEAINSAARRGRDQATGLACGIEIVICLLFTPIVFCCHCCIAELFNKGQIQRNMDIINTTRYGGRPVVTAINSSTIMIQTDFIIDPVAQVQVMQFAPVYTTAEALPAMAMPVYSKEGAVAPQIALQTTPQASQQVVRVPPQPVVPVGSRQMKFVIPQGVSAGQTVTVQLPDGTNVMVTVPPNTHAGQELTVAY